MPPPRKLPRLRRPRPPSVARPKSPKRVQHPPPPRSTVAPRSAPPQPEEDELIEEEKSILDLIDNLLNQGVVLSGELILGVAGVDLVYLRLNALLAAADRVLPRPEHGRKPAAALPSGLEGLGD